MTTDHSRPYPLDMAHDEVKLMMRAQWPGAVIRRTNPERPYDGQDHTDAGERGKTIVQDLTMRDIADCIFLGFFLASGLPAHQWPDKLHDLDIGDIDPGAVIQNAVCEIERRMGIFPNIPGERDD